MFGEEHVLWPPARNIGNVTLLRREARDGTLLSSTALNSNFGSLLYRRIIGWSLLLCVSVVYDLQTHREEGIHGLES